MGRQKFIVIPSHHIWRRQNSHGHGHRGGMGGGMTRHFVTERAYRPEACCTGCVLCCGGIQTPRPEDYDHNGVAYVLPPQAEAVHTAPMGRAASYGCCGEPVPDYADRTRMYPQFQPARQVMGMQAMAMGMPAPMMRPAPMMMPVQAPMMMPVQAVQPGAPIFPGQPPMTQEGQPPMYQTY